MINEGVRRAYLLPENKLRASVLADPAGKRAIHATTLPAVVNVSIVPGNKLDVIVAAKGGGSEAKSKFAMLNPSDSIVEWVLKTVPTMGAGWCPPGIIALGIGGTAEKAMLIAKEALMEPIDIQDLKARGASNRAEELRLELYDKINALGIGAQGLRRPHHRARRQGEGLSHPRRQSAGGDDSQLRRNPSRALHPRRLRSRSRSSRRHSKTGPSLPTARRGAPRQSRHGDPRRVLSWKPGEVILLSGKLLTGRDAAHKRMTEMLNRGEKLPVDFTNRFIYYVGPVDPVRDEAVGPAGPTTSTRMDKFTRQMLEQTGLLGMVGKAERGPAAIQAIKDNKAVYLMAVGGAAYLVSKAIKKSNVLAFADLGMEAIYEFEVEDMPVTVAVDSNGNAVHETGPREWKQRIAEMQVLS
jgi:fumarate hydratase, class I